VRDKEVLVIVVKENAEIVALDVVEPIQSADR
jgi:hypothetical protein